MCYFAVSAYCELLADQHVGRRLSNIFDGPLCRLGRAIAETRADHSRETYEQRH